MQRAAALLQQQGSHALIPRQPARSSGLLPASPWTVLSCQRRRHLSHHGLITPAAAAWPLQPRCAPSSRRPVACRASSSQPSSSADSNPSSSSSSSSSSADTTAAAAAAPSSSQQKPPATAAATTSSLTVEAVQTDPAATIDAIQRLTSPSQSDATPAAAAASESAAAAGSATTADQQQQTEQQQQQGAFESFLAAVAAAWAGFQMHWQTLVGFCAAALAAVKASLAKFPAWVAAQKLQKLQEAADGTPTDAAKQAAYLTALNSNAHPREVLARVESKTYASNPAVVVEYLKALVATERLNEYADSSSSSSSSKGATGTMLVGGGATPAPGQDHRSLLALLKELQGLAGGGAGGSSEAPGSSLRRPLHVVLQGPGMPKVSKVAGPFRALWNLVGVLTLLMGLSAAWLVGSQALRSAAAGSSLGMGGVVVTSSAAAGAGGAAAPSASTSGSAGPAIEPKEYKREEMPERSIKTFADVLGCDESKAELQEVVEFLKEPGKFTRLGAKLPKGVLLTGPPGTGKTLLARAVAGEAGVPFFYRAGSEFEELYVGVGSRRMRALFGAAKKKAPCIVFIDEIDAIGGNRKHWENHTRKTLNQLLVEMDGFESNEGVIVMAATNLPETLDPALKRPGRFDRQVAVPLPDVKGRADILGHYLQDKPVAPGLDKALLARQTSGFSGADLANLVNEAALLAAKQGADAITSDMVDYAFDKVLMGVERKSAVRSPEALKRTAYHEGGHALVALTVPGASPVHKATIVPRGHALGMVTQVGREDEFSINRQQMIARILVSMGGTVAEELVFGRDQVSSGATDDLRQATNLARHMVMQCGLNDAVGPVFIEDGDMKGLSEGLRQQVDEEVRSILTTARAQVKSLLTERLDQLHLLAGALVEHETLNAGQIKAVLAGEKLAPALLHLGVDSSSSQPDAAAAAAGAAADDVRAGPALEEQ